MSCPVTSKVWPTLHRQMFSLHVVIFANAARANQKGKHKWKNERIQGEWICEMYLSPEVSQEQASVRLDLFSCKYTRLHIKLGTGPIKPFTETCVCMQLVRRTSTLIVLPFLLGLYPAEESSCSTNAIFFSSVSPLRLAYLMAPYEAIYKYTYINLHQSLEKL